VGTEEEAVTTRNLGPRRLAAVAVLFTILGLAIGGALARPGSASFWRDRYSPTNLKWLQVTLQLKASLDCRGSQGPGYCVGTSYVVSADDTIAVFLEAHGDPPVDYVRVFEKAARGRVKMYAEKVFRREAPKVEVFRQMNGETVRVEPL
jgi:hypothetical protein